MSDQLPDLSSIVKAYDVRGVVPDQLNEEVARALGAAFAKVTGAPEDRDRARHARVVGAAVAAFAEGAISQGTSVVEAGLGSTDMLYFASGSLGPARRDVHRQPQPGAVQRHQAVPRRARAGRAGPRPGRDPAARRADPAANELPLSDAAARRAVERRPARRLRAATCAGWSTCPGSGR